MTDQSALFTDFYSLTMAHGYWKKRMNHRAVFEMFFRRQPFGGGFSVFAGLETLLDRLSDFSFSADDIAYLRSLNFFDAAFLDYLKGFHFTGSLWSMDEGQVVFPQEPLIRIDGGLIECQILEGMLLNIINFQSLIATKTARVWLASGKGSIMEFGLRRAQGPDGAVSASRAAFIGGAAGTSNVLAGKRYGIPVMGTMAHSWVMAYPSEAEAFQSYADLYPGNTVFLIDTYDTLKSGIQNAVQVGKRLAAQGKNFGVRLDSGDIHYLSVEVRKILDAAGFTKATITVSNDLDESIIQTLTDAGAPVNFWGVGTRMVTGGTESAFTGVYKLAAKEGPSGGLIPTIKFSDNPEKTTTPGVKQVWRIRDPQGIAVADILSLDEADAGEETLPDGRAGGDVIVPGKRYAFWHPQADYRHFYHTPEGAIEALLQIRIRGGERIGVSPSLEKIREKVRTELDTFDQSYKRFLNPHVYKVSVTEQLRSLKLELIKNYLGDL
ncbi:MAG: nicotinate phosphoribosyltransferase [Spirochaetaceae bacterium]|jgi:nicotinate phosphoribosyltransferase|nr:nicotinate phosphoribosyltransferase [Spirochaetaceae bacterium]